MRLERWRRERREKRGRASARRGVAEARQPGGQSGREQPDASAGPPMNSRRRLRSFAEEFRDDENHDGTGQSAAKDEVEQRIAGGSDGWKEGDDVMHVVVAG